MTAKMRINRSIKDIYEWKISDSLSDIEAKVRIPNFFNLDDIRTNLSDAKDAIAVEAEGRTPIIKGRLYAPVTGIQVTKTQEEMIITLDKKTKSPWPILIKDVFPGTEEIDPQSAFRIACFIKNDRSDTLINEAISAGYVPAILYEVEELEKKPKSKSFVENLLKIAADEYDDPIAMFKLANILSKKGGNMEASFGYYARSAKKEFYPSIVAMGRFLSPCSDVEWRNKDPSRALTLFEVAIEKANDPCAMHEAAKLYFNGLGTEKNVEKANMLQSKAKKLDPKTDNMQTLAELEKKPKIPIAISLFAAAAVVCGIAYLLKAKLMK